MEEIYSKLKVLHHWDKIDDLKNGKQPVPIAVRMVISDLCNHNCHFCTFRMEDSFTNKMFSVIDPKTGDQNYNPSRFLSKDKIFEIIDDCAEMGVASIEFTGGGEPTVHPDHVEIFKKVNDAGLDFALITNGALFRKGFANEMMNATWCRFSLDAGTPESYSKIRQISKDQFKKVLKNIETLVKKRTKSKSDLTIGISFIITDENYGEIYDAAKIASSLGVDNFRLGYYRTDDGFSASEKWYEVIDQILLSKKDFERDGFSIIDRYTEASANIDGRPDYEMCGYQNISTWIAGDGNVYRCCVTSYDNHGLIGSIEDKRFKELWESDEKKALFDNFDARSCEQCIYNEKNRMINYLVNQLPDHVNFL